MPLPRLTPTSLSRIRISRIPLTLSRKCSLHTQPQPTHGSINQAEIAHFSKLSQHWWDEQGEFAFLHQMNPVRMQFVRDKLVEIGREENDDASTNVHSNNVLSGLDVLDVGCGGGLLSESLARMGATTLGIDASESNIGIAQLHASSDPKLSLPSPTLGTPPLQYRHTSAETLLQEQKQYDVVCSMEVLEHVDNPASFLSTCAQLVKPGGHLFLSTISRTPLAYALTIFFAEDVLGKVSKGTHTYSKYVKPSELLQFFREYTSPTQGSPSKPWISVPETSGYIPRTEAEVRGLIYNPILSRWHLAPKEAWGALECNYIFWVRRPKE